MVRQCGRITIDRLNGKYKECKKEARWLSPPRLRASGRLSVCDQHKREMAEEYRYFHKSDVFQRL